MKAGGLCSEVHSNIALRVRLARRSPSSLSRPIQANLQLLRTMPPVCLTTQALTTRLTALSESNKAVGQLIQRLAKLDFQPGSQPVNSEEGDVRLELSAEIHESLKGIEEDLELLRQEVEDVVGIGNGFGRRRDSKTESERSRLAVLQARLTEDLRAYATYLVVERVMKAHTIDSSRSQFRKAQLTAKHNADRAKLKERELLFSNLQSGTSTPTSTYRQRKQAKGISEGEVVAQASSDVTAALRRTHQLMQGELSRSRFAQETLEQSTAALADLGEKYSDLNTLLANSKNLVSTLVKSTKSDTWYLETTFYILITTVIWLIFRRWLYGPLTWFVIRPIAWFIIWPLRVLFRNLPSVFGTAAAAATTTTSLIIKPSAIGGSPKINHNAQQPYFRVGGGNRGYMHGAGSGDPSPPDSYSQKIGKMAEKNQQQQQNEEVPDHPQFREPRKDEDEGPVRRGDGTILQESNKPRNPKKRMWEENVESAKYEAKKEEQAAAAGEGSVRKDKDEL